MTDADAELRALQSRAYGRDADIGGDPEAMRRLADLEAPQPVEPSVAVAPSSATPVSAPEAQSAAPASVESEPVPRPGSFNPRPRTAWIAVAGAAVAVVAAVSASIAVAVTAAARPVEPGLVDTIAVDPGADWWDALGERTDGSVLFEDWHGLTFVRNEGWSEIDDQRCLLGVPTDTVRSASNGFTAIGMECSAGAFPASLQIIVDAGQPDELRDRFPEGTALKFTLRGDTVEVRADTQDG